MKILIYILLFLVIPNSLSVLSAQESSDSIKFGERIPPDLELEIKVTAASAIAYADCFIAKVLKVNRGEFKDSTIFITIVAGDKENYNIITSGDENTVFKIFCIHNKYNEEYHTTYITGFVDSEMSSWKIISIQKKIQ